jgi:hypothetical protein
MAFGNYEIKADFGSQRIVDRNSATAFMLTLTAIYRNKPHWKLADQARRESRLRLSRLRSKQSGSGVILE